MKWAFTFGSAHYMNDGTPLANRFVCVDGGFSEARDVLFNAIGVKWSMQYDYATFNDQIYKYNLVEISLDELKADGYGNAKEVK